VRIFTKPIGPATPDRFLFRTAPVLARCVTPIARRLSRAITRSGNAQIV
jgi:hypothetical protein